jgi:hypothetical protein
MRCRWWAATPLLLSSWIGCGTKVLEPRLADEPDAPSMPPSPPPLPPCPPGMGPIDATCARCVKVNLKATGMVDSCLECDPAGGSPGGQCRTCHWTKLPVDLVCEQCPGGEAGPKPPDLCQATLDQARATL